MSVPTPVHGFLLLVGDRLMLLGLILLPDDGHFIWRLGCMSIKAIHYNKKDILEY